MQTRKGKGIKKPVKSSKESKALREPAPEQIEFEDDVNVVPKIPKLEAKARKIGALRDEIKDLQAKEKGLSAEAIIIMHEHEIKVYDSRDGVHLRINESETLKVELD